MRSMQTKERTMTKEPTIAAILADAKKQGFVVTKAPAKVNGQSAYKVKGKHGLFTKQGLMQLVGY